MEFMKDHYQFTKLENTKDKAKFEKYKQKFESIN